MIGYLDAYEHLADELARLDVMIRVRLAATTRLADMSIPTACSARSANAQVKSPGPQPISRIA